MKAETLVAAMIHIIIIITAKKQLNRHYHIHLYNDSVT